MYLANINSLKKIKDYVIKYGTSRETLKEAKRNKRKFNEFLIPLEKNILTVMIQ